MSLIVMIKIWKIKDKGCIYKIQDLTDGSINIDNHKTEVD